MDKRNGLTTRLASSILCGAILLVSPGPAAYAAAGQVSAVQVSAPANASMGMVGGSLNAGISSAINTQFGLAPISLSSKLSPGQAAPAVTVQGITAPQTFSAVAAPAQESPVAVAENIAAPVAPAPLLAAPASESRTLAPASGESSVSQQAASIDAGTGAMAAPASRVKVGFLRTLRSIFSSSKEDASMPVVAGAASAVSSTLRPAAPAETSVSAVPAAPAAASPAPAASKLKTILRWALPIAALTALVFGLDFGTKFLAAKYIFTVFHECAWRAPLLAGIIPYIGVTAFIARKSLPDDHKMWRWSAKQIRNGRLGFYRVELSGMDQMVKDHPSLKWALRLYDVSIGMMLGGMLGNGIDAFRLGGALDWIPLGRSLMNFADVALLLGLAFFQLATNFFIKAGAAHHDGKPLHFSTVGFLGLPLVGFFIAWAFGSAAAEAPLMLAMKSIAYIYLMGFSMLLGISRFLAALMVDRFAKKYKEGEAARKPA